MSPSAKKKKKKKEDIGPFKADEITSVKKKPTPKPKKGKYGLYDEPWLEQEKFYMDTQGEYKDSLDKEPWLEKEKFYQDQFDDEDESDINSEYYYKKKKRKKRKYSDGDTWEGMDF